MAKAGRPCTCCSSPRVGALNSALHDPARPTIAAIAKRFGLSPSSVERHAASHIGRGTVGQAMAEATSAPGTVPSLPGLDPMSPGYGDELARRTHALLEATEKKGSYREAIAALRLALEAHETQLKRIAAMPPDYAPERDVVLTALRGRVYGALRGFPDALEAVRAAFGETDAA